jgi:hypothetical protein
VALTFALAFTLTFALATTAFALFPFVFAFCFLLLPAPCSRSAERQFLAARNQRSRRAAWPTTAAAANNT